MQRLIIKLGGSFLGPWCRKKSEKTPNTFAKLEKIAKTSRNIKILKNIPLHLETME